MDDDDISLGQALAWLGIGAVVGLAVAAASVVWGTVSLAAQGVEAVTGRRW